VVDCFVVAAVGVVGIVGQLADVFPCAQPACSIAFTRRWAGEPQAGDAPGPVHNPVDGGEAEGLGRMLQRVPELAFNCAASAGATSCKDLQDRRCRALHTDVDSTGVRLAENYHKIDMWRA
jgi:hypothetical protein